MRSYSNPRSVWRNSFDTGGETKQTYQDGSIKGSTGRFVARSITPSGMSLRQFRLKNSNLERIRSMHKEGFKQQKQHKNGS